MPSPNSAPLDRPAVSLFHEDPPLTPRSVIGSRPVLLGLVATTVVVLAVLAAFDGGEVLLTVDEPIARWVSDHRTDTWTDLFDTASRLGDNTVVFPLAAIAAVLVWPRCRMLAIAIVGAAAFRPAVEFVLKATIDRERPTIDPLGEFGGPSHPSGHPLAATSFWGMLPAALAVYRVHRAVWWGAALAVVVIVPAVAAARVYKGAHWATDVTASLLWGSLYLLAVQGAFDRFHDRSECVNPAPPGPLGPDVAPGRDAS